MIGRRLIDFVSEIVVRGIPPEDVVGLARSKLFRQSEADTAVYCYGQFDEPERHGGGDLVVRFMDGGCKVAASWQGASVAVEGNFPAMGWDYDDGEYGLGGDWWQYN